MTWRWVWGASGRAAWLLACGVTGERNDLRRLTRSVCHFLPQRRGATPLRSRVQL